MEVVEYRFRHGGHRVRCTFRFHYSEAGGLQLDSLGSLHRSEVTCTTNTQASLNPTGDSDISSEQPLSSSASSSDLVVKTPCGSRFKLDLVIEDGVTLIMNEKLKYLGREIPRETYLRSIIIFIP